MLRNLLMMVSSLRDRPEVEVLLMPGDEELLFSHVAGVTQVQEIAHWHHIAGLLPPDNVVQGLSWIIWKCEQNFG